MPAAALPSPVAPWQLLQAGTFGEAPVETTEGTSTAAMQVPEATAAIAARAWVRGRRR